MLLNQPPSPADRAHVPRRHRQRGRGDITPLLSYVPFDGSGGERIAHLPIDAELAQALSERLSQMARAMVNQQQG